MGRTPFYFRYGPHVLGIFKSVLRFPELHDEREVSGMDERAIHIASVSRSNKELQVLGPQSSVLCNSS